MKKKQPRKRNGVTWDGPPERKETAKPKPPTKKRNSQASADAAQSKSAEFHGRSSGKVREYTEEIETPTNLADLGRLRTLEISTPFDEEYTLILPGVRVGCTPDGGQLYFVGGMQAVNLDALGIDEANKDHVDLGECLLISYITKKGFHDFENIEYGHNFGEDGGTLPSLHYDVRNRLLYLTGGSYVVTAAGIEN